VVGQVFAYGFEVGVDGSVVILPDFEGRFVDEVWWRLDGWWGGRVRWGVEMYVHMTAWGSLEREVPRRNLRRCSFVSGEKV
jgi:hypothetical protein